MKKKLIVTLLSLMTFTGFSQVVYNPLDSTYVFTAKAASKVLHLAQNGIYLDSMMLLNEQLYQVLEEVNLERDLENQLFEEYRMQYGHYCDTAIVTLYERQDVLKKEIRKQKGWKNIAWSVVILVITGSLIF